MLEAVASVSDRLVKGMMFHSDHADMMRLVGVKGLRRLHERGFRDDSSNMRKVRKACITHLGTIPPHGRQERTSTLDSLTNRNSDGIGASERQRLIRSSMNEWVEWESGTVSLYDAASKKLQDHAVLWDLVRGFQSETERELAHAREILQELEACGYDMCHILEME